MSTKTYKIGFSVRVECDGEVSGHRISVPVEASSAESAAAQLADALSTVLAAERRIGAKESKSK